MVFVIHVMVETKSADELNSGPPRNGHGFWPLHGLIYFRMGEAPRMRAADQLERLYVFLSCLRPEAWVFYNLTANNPASDRGPVLAQYILADEQAEVSAWSRVSQDEMRRRADESGRSKKLRRRDDFVISCSQQENWSIESGKIDLAT